MYLSADTKISGSSGRSCWRPFGIAGARLTSPGGRPEHGAHTAARFLLLMDDEIDIEGLGGQASDESLTHAAVSEWPLSSTPIPSVCGF